MGDAGILIATVSLTLVVLIFAEITPKTIAALHPEAVAFPATLLLVPLLKLSTRWWLVSKITNGLLHMLGVDPEGTVSEHLSKEELRTLVAEGGALIPARRKHMMLNLLALEEVSVNDIMVPRNEVYGIDLDDSDDDILRCIQTSSHTACRCGATTSTTSWASCTCAISAR